MSKTIYKNEKSKSILMDLYDRELIKYNVEFKSIYIDTYAGKTHILRAGDITNPPIIILHGIHAGAAITLNAIKGLTDKYCLYIIDTIGQATKSSETILPLKGNYLAKWLSEVLDKLELANAPFIGISYGGFLLQKLITYYPKRVSKAIFLVPAGFTNGSFKNSFKKLTIPLVSFLLFKKEKNLIKFMSAFYSEINENDVLFQKTILTGVKMDYRRPSILKKADVEKFTSPVFILAAENDIFFPATEAIKKCENLFSNFQDSYIIQDSKHIPSEKSFQIIEDKIRKWLQ